MKDTMNNNIYLNADKIVSMDDEDWIGVKEFLIMKYLNTMKGIGELKRRRLFWMLYMMGEIRDEYGIVYKRCKVSDVIFCFRNDLTSGKLDNCFNFMLLLNEEGEG